ncbi:MAG: hypothetical protein QW416_08020 [Candidatus Nitrosocaldaceae archaeon]
MSDIPLDPNDLVQSFGYETVLTITGITKKFDAERQQDILVIEYKTENGDTYTDYITIISKGVPVTRKDSKWGLFLTIIATTTVYKQIMEQVQKQDKDRFGTFLDGLIGCKFRCIAFTNYPVNVPIIDAVKAVLNKDNSIFKNKRRTISRFIAPFEFISRNSVDTKTVTMQESVITDEISVREDGE